MTAKKQRHFNILVNGECLCCDGGNATKRLQQIG